MSGCTTVRVNAKIELCGLDRAGVMGIQIYAERLVEEELRKYLKSVAACWPGQETFDLTVGSHKEDG